MDVGFNNINFLHLTIDGHTTECLENIEWIVEANSDERHWLWQENHEDHEWKEHSVGYWHTIMELDLNISKKSSIDGKNVRETLPVNISFNFAEIDGHKICFYYSPSLLVHHGYIEAFMCTYFQRTHDNFTRWNHVDAANFHNCINYLDTIDKSPRNTVYTPSADTKKYFVFKPISYKKYMTKTYSKEFGL